MIYLIHIALYIKQSQRGLDETTESIKRHDYQKMWVPLYQTDAVAGEIPAGFL